MKEETQKELEDHLLEQFNALQKIPYPATSQVFACACGAIISILLQCMKLLWFILVEVRKMESRQEGILDRSEATVQALCRIEQMGYDHIVQK